MTGQIQDEFDTPVVIRSGGQGIVVDVVTWLFGKLTQPRELRIDVCGLAIQGFFGSIRKVAWEEVASFGVTGKYP